jgi:hypothetical protein
MHHPNTTYIAKFADPPAVTENEVDFKLIHQGPDSGEDTTLKIVSNNGILVSESNGELHIGSIVQIEQINNETITFETDATDAAISLGTTTEFTTNSSTSETITINHGATGSGAAQTSTNSGQTVIQNISLDKFGHVQSITNGTVVGQYLMAATGVGEANLRFDTQANGQSGSAQDVTLKGGGAVVVRYVNSTEIEIDVDSSQFALGSIDGHTDVDITTNAPTNGQALKWDGTNFVPGDVAVSLAMDDLSDVSTAGIADGQAIIYDGTSESFVAGNAGETYTAGTGLSLDANNEFTNSAPDQTVALTGSGATSVTGTYPNFTISSTDTNTDTNTTYTAGNGLTLTGTVFKMSGTYTGDFTATGDITAFGTSDERLKTNISVIDSALDKINKISGYTFNWNELAEDKDQTLREAGVLAQEIEEVLPEVTTTREDGYKAVRYEKLVPLLIEAIKELSEKVERLEREK